ncbi:mandelate racemase/muconate lactonizing enzyme family protein [Candidimonas humi]|jgi:galactonate dehydratase|uniref:Mandelate racemase/muconate lactonizing enzyme family protein n=1 Tax=Candidimonas humi TaxID=683355 RepID=A0ABV8P3S4_9BURK|nr:mandelate racemase/muconate lactonizing enzyme family protein [Candidimonas humi]MBV6306925.1 mandelate racemase/muconate lactonizing enzyme family protein [Candidimonas humi]
MKVVKVECLVVHPGWRKNLVFVRIETEDGLVGWGEAYSQYDRDRAIAAQVEALGQYLVGRDAFHIRHFVQIAFDDYAQRRASLEYWCAVSGIEQALWDLAGKATNQPVYNLLGGPCRQKIRVYANGWSYKMHKPEDFARAAEKVVRAGFTAMKFDPLPRPWRTYVPKEHIRHAVQVLRAVRVAVGPDVDLLLDIHRRLAPMHAIALSRALAEFEPYWFEEPCQAENMEALAEVRAASPIPVVSGEALYGRADFRRLFRQRAVDIINPDVSNCGGILELMQIASAAEVEMVAVSPHNYNSTTLSLSATVHAAACMPNFTLTEYFLPYEEFGHVVTRNPLVPVNGYITLPQEPGLGLDVIEEAVRARPGQEYPARTFRMSEDETAGEF